MIEEMQKFWLRHPDHWVEWITIDKDGDVEGHDSKPSCEEGRWWNDGGASIYLDKNHIPSKHPKYLIWQRPTIEDILEYKLEKETKEKEQLSRELSEWRKVRYWSFRKRWNFLICGREFGHFPPKTLVVKNGGLYEPSN